MKVYGIDISVKNVPELDSGFIPLSKFAQAAEKSTGDKFPLAIAV